MNIFEELEKDAIKKQKKNKKGKTDGKVRVGESLENTMLYLAENHKLKHSKKFKKTKMQAMSIFVFDVSIVLSLLDKLKFKDCGNIYDYDEFDLPKSIETNSSFKMNFDMLNRIAISTKYNALVLYNKEFYGIRCKFYISTKKLKKFSEIVSEVVMDDDRSNCLKGEDLTCKKGQYIEINDARNDNTKKYDLVRKNVSEEKLVFDKGSTLYKVKNDIISFFAPKTEQLYKQLEIPYKRGIILSGEPGNGKSTMIRDILRTAPENVIKIIIGRVSNFTLLLSSLMQELNGKKAIVIIEDMDSIISHCDRSELLNILDGVEVKSGMYLIGTTNYIGSIDSGFVNRAGRFDKTYTIGNPDKRTRELFFISKGISKILSNYGFSKNNPNISEEEIIKCFVKNSKGLPMASLKELITTVSYELVYGEDKYVKPTVERVYKEMMASREQHNKMYNDFNNNHKKQIPSRKCEIVLETPLTDEDDKETTTIKKKRVLSIKKKK